MSPAFVARRQLLDRLSMLYQSMWRTICTPLGNSHYGERMYCNIVEDSSRKSRITRTFLPNITITVLVVYLGT